MFSTDKTNFILFTIYYLVQAPPRQNYRQNRTLGSADDKKGRTENEVDCCGGRQPGTCRVSGNSTVPPRLVAVYTQSNTCDTLIMWEIELFLESGSS